MQQAGTYVIRQSELYEHGRGSGTGAFKRRPDTHERLRFVVKRRQASAAKRYGKSGGGGIRTPETREGPAGFQDRCIQPGSATPPCARVLRGGASSRPAGAGNGDSGDWGGGMKRPRGRGVGVSGTALQAVYLPVTAIIMLSYCYRIAIEPFRLAASYHTLRGKSRSTLNLRSHL